MGLKEKVKELLKHPYFWVCVIFEIIGVYIAYDQASYTYKWMPYEWVVEGVVHSGSRMERVPITPTTEGLIIWIVMTCLGFAIFLGIAYVVAKGLLES